MVKVRSRFVLVFVWTWEFVIYSFFYFAFRFSEFTSKSSISSFDASHFMSANVTEKIFLFGSSFLDLHHLRLDEKPQNGRMVKMLWWKLSFKWATKRRERWLGRFCWSIGTSLVLFTAIAVQTEGFEMQEKQLFWKLVKNVLVEPKSGKGCLIIHLYSLSEKARIKYIVWTSFNNHQ